MDDADYFEDGVAQDWVPATLEEIFRAYDTVRAGVDCQQISGHRAGFVSYLPERGRWVAFSPCARGYFPYQDFYTLAAAKNFCWRHYCLWAVDDSTKRLG